MFVNWRPAHNDVWRSFLLHLHYGQLLLRTKYCRTSVWGKNIRHCDCPRWGCKLQRSRPDLVQHGIDCLGRRSRICDQKLSFCWTSDCSNACASVNKQYSLVLVKLLVLNSSLFDCLEILVSGITYCVDVIVKLYSLTWYLPEGMYFVARKVTAYLIADTYMN